MQPTADRLESILAAAAALASSEERAAYLDQACAGDAALRQQVEGLLKAHDQAGHFLDRPAPRPEPANETAGYVPPREQVGTVIAGRYKLLEEIGEGGMGSVWVAEQTQPVRRKVALKLIKAGMDSKTVLSRFEAERQALALMDHPNIAKVLDGGTTESGRPFFVMEYVKGVPITRYCDDTRLSIADRLALFVPVCQAVQHAHQKGIIHRDLKPSNILICLYDGQPVPKVIDFGLAKAMHQPLTEHTLYTAHGLMMGTPLYMSPEQAEFNNLDVDTRTDIYSLGVLLYELLTGTTPLEKNRFKEAAWQEMLRLIKDVEPPRPSTRLSGSGSLPSVAAQRRLEPVKLTKLVRGELDWIVMKCLEKDRGRRYETANGLAADLKRYLADEPVQACPPSTAYRLRKFARKHQAGLAMTAVLAAVLLLGAVVSTLQAVRATRAEAVALTSLAETEAARAAEAEQRQLSEAAEQKARAAAGAEKQAKETALAREAETRAVLEFVENQVFAAARPEGQAGGLGREVTLRRAIEAALPFVDKSFHDQPLIEARLRWTLGSSFYYLGERKMAAEQYELARTIYIKHLGSDHPDTLRIIRSLANSYYALGRHTDASKLYEETLAIQKAKLGPDHPHTLQTMQSLASIYQALGQRADALKLYEETLALQKAKLGLDHLDTLQCMSGLAYCYAAFGRHAEALKLREETHRRRRAKLGPDHPTTLESAKALADTYVRLGRQADALKLHEETLALQRAKLGSDHPSTLRSMDGLAKSYDALGRNADALRLREDLLVLQKAKLGIDHPETLRNTGGLAMSFAAVGRHSEAIKLTEELLPLMKAKQGPTHPDTATAMNALAWFLLTSSDVKLRNPARALELAKKSIEVMSTNPNFWGTCGTARYQTGDWKGAIADLERAIGLRAPDDHVNANEGFFLAMAQWQLGDKDRARDWFAKSAQWMERDKENAELKRFRAEAAELLGVEKKD
jgi:serine/threonine protein kinase/tetratricopeptide (TPR) repeat protein